MSKLLALGAAFALTLALVPSSARAQCDAGSVQSEAAHSDWKVNNAGGEGFGGWFVASDGEAEHEDKPEVAVAASGDGLVVGRSGELALSNFHAEAGDNGGAWCAFSLGDYPARIGHADNGWWIFEIGAHDSGQIELIHR